MIMMKVPREAETYFLEHFMVASHNAVTSKKANAPTWQGNKVNSPRAMSTFSRCVEKSRRLYNRSR